MNGDGIVDDTKENKGIKMNRWDQSGFDIVYDLLEHATDVCRIRYNDKSEHKKAWLSIESLLQAAIYNIPVEEDE